MTDEDCHYSEDTQPTPHNDPGKLWTPVVVSDLQQAHTIIQDLPNEGQLDPGPSERENLTNRCRCLEPLDLEEADAANFDLHSLISGTMKEISRSNISTRGKEP